MRRRLGGYLVITCSSDRIAERENSYVRLLRSMRAATLIFAGSGLDDPVLNEEMRKHLAAMRGYGAAVVHLSPHAFGEAEVGVDNAGGIASMVAELVRLGHRQIAFLAGPTSLYVARQRLAGYRRGLADAGIPFDERLVVSTGFNRDGGALGIDTLLAGAAPFTAVCAANDLLALGALQRLAELGIAVPGEVSVAGFDDIQTAAMAAPRLSTVRLPLHEIGRRGFAFAERQLAGARPRPEVLPTELVMRDSTAPPPASALPRALADRRDRGGRLMGGMLADRVVLVTGSSRGIGAEVAVKAAAEGASVAVHYLRSAEAAEGRRGARPEPRRREPRPSPPTSATAARRRAGRRGSSTGSGAWTASSTTPDGRWSGRSSRSSRPTGTRSSAPTSRPPSTPAARRCPRWSSAAAGRSSTSPRASARWGIAETAAYSAAKAGLIGLTRALAREFGPRGIRVNAVAPGVTITEMTTDLVDSEEGRRRLRDMPLGRFGRADEVADSVIFLLSDASSLFLGQTLNPNAGGYMP